LLLPLTPVFNLYNALRKKQYLPYKTPFFAILTRMIKHFYASACRWLIHFITFQLFISLMSLPLLVAWGLPLSLLSPFGNSLFNPLLAFFLLISALLFITELIYLPNQWLCWLLEKINTLFIATSSSADSSWLVGIRQLPTLLLFCIPFIGLWIIITPRLRMQGARAMALTGALVVIFAGAYYTNSSYLDECRLANKDKPMVVAYADHTLAVFDQGTLSASFRCRSWWDYTLLSYITKKTGKTTIDYLVCLQPSRRTLEGIALVANATSLRHVILVLLSQTHTSLQGELETLMTELAHKKISCTLQILEKQNPRNPLSKTTPNTFSELSSCSCELSSEELCSYVSNKNSSKTYPLTAKISYRLHTSQLSRTSHLMGATITCDNQTLTMGTTTESDGLSTTAQNLDKQPSEL